MNKDGEMAEEWLELANGCLCCSVKSVLNWLIYVCGRVTDVLPPRDAGVKAVENLMKRKGKFDYIMLETTGLADPGNPSQEVPSGVCMRNRAHKSDISSRPHRINVLAR